MWALDGLDRLTETGSFTQPAASQDAARTMEDLASPVAAFVRERCTTGHQYAIGAKDLFAAWNEWCEVDEGRRPGTATVFGRNLSAAFPAVRRGRRRDAGDRVLIYEGIAFEPDSRGLRRRQGRGDRVCNVHWHQDCPLRHTGFPGHFLETITAHYGPSRPATPT